MENNKKRTITFVSICSILIAVLLVLGTLWMGSSSKKDTNKAVRSVSLMYLDELAGRSGQVVENNLQGNIKTIRIAMDLLTDEDLSDITHLEAYQSRIKKLYELDKFAFVDTQGLIYTSVGTQTNIDEYGFDYKTISEPEISVFNPDSPEKKVVIAVPVDVAFGGKTLCVCFMEIDMKVMLSGVLMDPGSDGVTFCNIYTKDGIALNNTVLGDISVNDNLIYAMKDAEFENGKIVVEIFEKSEPDYYDAILMDVRMPEMDGLEATKAIRALSRPDAKAVPIIAMTANAFDEDVQRSLHAGMNAHLSKPVESDLLYKTLEELIWKKDNEQGNNQ